MFNDSNTTEQIIKVIVFVNNSTSSDPHQIDATTIITILSSFILAILTCFLTYYFTTKNLKEQLKSQERTISLQIHQSEIIKSLKALIIEVNTGEKDNIRNFFNTIDSAYVPIEIKKYILTILEKDTIEVEDVNIINKRINDYIHQAK